MLRSNRLGLGDKFRQDLQYTAQHKTGSQVVEKHYALSNKPSHEAKLLEYLRVEFHEPAIEMLRGNEREGDTPGRHSVFFDHDCDVVV